MLYEETQGDAIITTGVGQHQMWAAQYYKFKEPRRWATSGGLGSMGFGLPSGAWVQAGLGCDRAGVAGRDGERKRGAVVCGWLWEEQHEGCAAPAGAGGHLQARPGGRQAVGVMSQLPSVWPVL